MPDWLFVLLVVGGAAMGGAVLGLIVSAPIQKELRYYRKREQALLRLRKQEAGD